MSKGEPLRTDRQEENEKRAERLKEELNRVFGVDISAEKLAEKLNIPLGTARGVLYKGTSPSNDKSILFAETLGIDATYWIMGLRLSVDAERLADCIAFVENIMAKRPKVDFTVSQVSTMITMVYNSHETVCKTVIETTMDLFQQLQTDKTIIKN